MTERPAQRASSVRRVGGRLALCIVLGVCGLADPAWAAPRMYVTPTQAKDPTTARIVDGATGAALAKALPDVEVVSADVLSAVTEVEAARQCLAVEATSSCLSELAGALDVDYLVRVQVASLDHQLVLTLVLIDGRQIRVVGQGQRMARKGNHAALLSSLPGLVREVASSAGLPTSPSPYVTPAVVGGVGVVVAGAGAAVLAGRGVASGAYADGALSRDDAVRFEQLDVPLLAGGIGAAVVGSILVVGAAARAGYVAVEGE